METRHRRGSAHEIKSSIFLFRFAPPAHPRGDRKTREMRRNNARLRARCVSATCCIAGRCSSSLHPRSRIASMSYRCIAKRDRDRHPMTVITSAHNRRIEKRLGIDGMRNLISLCRYKTLHHPLRQKFNGINRRIYFIFNASHCSWTFAVLHSHLKQSVVSFKTKM